MHENKIIEKIGGVDFKKFPDVWKEIISFLDKESLIKLGFTSKSLYEFSSPSKQYAFFSTPPKNCLRLVIETLKNESVQKNFLNSVETEKETLKKLNQIQTKTKWKACANFVSGTALATEFLMSFLNLSCIIFNTCNKKKPNALIATISGIIFLMHLALWLCLSKYGYIASANVLHTVSEYEDPEFASLERNSNRFLSPPEQGIDSTYKIVQHIKQNVENDNLLDALMLFAKKEFSITLTKDALTSNQTKQFLDDFLLALDNLADRGEGFEGDSYIRPSEKFKLLLPKKELPKKDTTIINIADSDSDNENYSRLKKFKKN